MFKFRENFLRVTGDVTACQKIKGQGYQTKHMLMQPISIFVHFEQKNASCCKMLLEPMIKCLNSLTRSRVPCQIPKWRWQVSEQVLTFSPGILFGLTPLMMQTASMTSRTPSGGRCIARTSTTSFLFRDLRLASAASYAHTGRRLHVRNSSSFFRSYELQESFHVY